ncbi:MAG: EamA family transporter [Planctomycetes bacterium]|nr:EamA family transporter [Planctomycetota bacterium]
MRGRLLLLAAALLWSTSGLFVKSPALSSLPAMTLACWRAVFATVVLVPFVPRGAVRWRPGLVPMTLFFAAMNVLFIGAMTRTTAAAAIFLQYTATVWAALFGALLLKERIDRGTVAAIACAAAGIGWIVAAEWQSENAAGNLIALASGASYAGVILMLRHLRDEHGPWLVALNHAVAALVLLPWIAAADVSLTPSQWGLVVMLGVFQMGLPYVLFAAAVRHVRAQEAALIVLVEPVLNPLWVWLAWGETPPGSTMAGGGLILGGLFVRYAIFPPRPIATATATK